MSITTCETGAADRCAIVGARFIGRKTKRERERERDRQIERERERGEDRKIKKKDRVW